MRSAPVQKLGAMVTRRANELFTPVSEVVSSTDLITAQAATRSAEERQIPLERTPVRDIMTPKPLIIVPTAELQAAARPMLYAEVPRPFVEEKSALGGRHLTHRHRSLGRDREDRMNGRGA